MSFSFNRLKRMEIESKQKSLKMSLLTNRTKARPESSGKASEFRSRVLTNPKQVLKKMTFHIPGSRKPPPIPKGVGFLGLCMNHLEHHLQNYVLMVIMPTKLRKQTILLRLMTLGNL